MKVLLAVNYAIKIENCKFQAIINIKKQLWKDILKKSKNIFIIYKKYKIN